MTKEDVVHLITMAYVMSQSVSFREGDSESTLKALGRIEAILELALELLEKEGLDENRDE